VPPPPGAEPGVDPGDDPGTGTPPEPPSGPDFPPGPPVGADGALWDLPVMPVSASVADRFRPPPVQIGSRPAPASRDPPNDDDELI
jgi:hypothetical protein